MRNKLDDFPAALPRAAEEPYERLDDLVAYIRKQTDDPDLGRWFVENLASDLDIPLIPTFDEPVANWAVLAAIVVQLLADVGENPERRQQVSTEGLLHASQVIETIMMWGIEEDQKRRRARVPEGRAAKRV